MSAADTLEPVAVVFRSAMGIVRVNLIGGVQFDFSGGDISLFPASALEASEAKIVALTAENDGLREKVERAEREMANVIEQADCLRCYASMTDGARSAPLPTVGELQAGHFEDIAVRAFPSLMPLLERKRSARAALRQEGKP